MGTLGAPSNELISGLEAAVTAAPDNLALRLHLMEKLNESDRSGEAFAHAEQALRLAPDSIDAHRAAALCARILGDPRADAFARVAAALDAPAPPVPPAPAAAPPVPEPVAEPVAQAVVEPAAAPRKEVVAEAALPVEEPVADEATAHPDEGSADELDHQVAAFCIDPEQIERPRLTFQNIIGVEDVKARIGEVILDPLRARNGSSRALGGVLMFGPPGCGKGFFARMIAGELQASYLPINMAQAMDWPGDPRENVHRVFAAARHAAPCVLFLDDIDLAGVRAEGDGQPDRRLLARLASEIGNTGANRGVLIFGGTTSPWDVDMALRADGGLERTLLVLPPDVPAREAILRFHLKDARLSGVDISWIVDRTQHFSGDDLLLLCDRARLLAQQDALGNSQVIGPGHMTRALREVRPTAPAWFSLVMEQAMSAHNGGMYDEAVAYIDAHQLT